MRISKRQLRRIIKEYVATIPARSFEEWDSLADEYEAWVEEHGHITPSASSVMASFFIDKDMYDHGAGIQELADHYGIERVEVKGEIIRQMRERNINKGL